MSDPLMEEIWRVREHLLVEHGGMEGLLEYVLKLEQAHPKNVSGVGGKRRKIPAAKRPDKSTSGVNLRSRNAAKAILADPLLDRIQRARQSLIAQHGSAEAYIDDVIRRDADRRKKLKQRRTKTMATKQKRTARAERVTSKQHQKV